MILRRYVMFFFFFKVETIRHELVKLGEDIDGPEYKSTGGGKRRRRMKRCGAVQDTCSSELIVICILK